MNVYSIFKVPDSLLSLAVIKVYLKTENLFTE